MKEAIKKANNGANNGNNKIIMIYSLISHTGLVLNSFDSQIVIPMVQVGCVENFTKLCIQLLD